MKNIQTLTQVSEKEEWENSMIERIKKREETPTVVEKSDHEHVKRRMSPFGHLFRFFGWWFGFTGLYSMFAVCPFCGQQGCPVGLVSAGSVGAFFALCLQDWKLFFGFVRRKFSKQGKEKMSSNNRSGGRA